MLASGSTLRSARIRSAIVRNLLNSNKTDMELADIEEECDQVLITKPVLFTSFNAVTAEKWEELEFRNYLRLSVQKGTREEELPRFFAELLSRRKKTSLEGVCIQLNCDYNYPEKNEKLLRCFKGILSSKSRVYLK